MKSAALALALLVAAPAAPAFAHDDGEAGDSGKTASAACTSCHTGGGAPTVTFSSGPSTLATGATGTYTFKITGGAAVAGGLDIAASSGTLVATETDTQIMTSELTHKAPKLFASGAVTWSFNYTAPSTAATVTLYGAGNSTNHDGTSAGDNSATTTMTIMVTAAADMAPAAADMSVAPPAADLSVTSSGSADASSEGTGTGTGTTTNNGAVTPQAADTGCTYDGKDGGWFALLACGALLLVARRRRAQS